MSRDAFNLAQAKLQGEWSAPEFAKSLSAEVLRELLPRFDKLEPLVRVRLLLACLSLEPATRAAMDPELQVWLPFIQIKSSFVQI